MRKDLTIKGKGNLSKAREEYEKFKSKQIARSAEKQASPKQSQALIDHKKASAILMCSNKRGATAQMTFELMPETARLISASALKPTLTMATTNHDNHIMLKRELKISSAYDGCPHCNEKGIIHCSCGSLCCIRSNSKKHTCPSCGKTSGVKPLLTPIAISGTRQENKPKAMRPKQNAKALSHKSQLLLTRKK